MKPIALAGTVALSFSALSFLALGARAAPNTGSVSKAVEPSMVTELGDGRDAPRARDTVKKKDAKEPIQFGFLGGVGFPRPLAAEVMLKIADTVSIGGEYSAMPSASFGGAEVGYHAYAVDLRIFPLQSSFFVGVRALRQHLAASATVTSESYGSFTGSQTIDTWFINPRLGFLWTTKSGLSIGMDAGVQIPVSHTSDTSLPSALPAGAQVPSGLTSVTETLGVKILPTVTVLQLGMLF